MKESAEKQVFTAGMRLRLLPAQAAGKAHALRFVGRGVYELLSPLEFDKSEKIEVVSAPKAAPRAVQNVAKKAVKEDIKEE